MASVALALIVTGQIRTLSDPRLLMRWHKAVIKPLAPVSFLSVNIDWIRGQANRDVFDGPHTNEETMLRIRQTFKPQYCAITQAMVHTKKIPFSRPGAMDWYRLWADAWRGLVEYEVAENKTFDVVLHARPDLIWNRHFVPDFFASAKGRSFAFFKWDIFLAMSRDLAETRLTMIEQKDFLLQPDFCLGAVDVCNIMWLLSHARPDATIARWPSSDMVQIQRHCYGVNEDPQKHTAIDSLDTYDGICSNSSDNIPSGNILEAWSSDEWSHLLRCSATYVCKEHDILHRSDCLDAANRILNSCSCGEEKQVENTSVCVSRCCI